MSMALSAGAVLQHPTVQNVAATFSKASNIKHTHGKLNMADRLETFKEDKRWDLSIRDASFINTNELVLKSISPLDHKSRIALLP